MVSRRRCGEKDYRGNIEARLLMGSWLPGNLPGDSMLPKPGALQNCGSMLFNSQKHTLKSTLDKHKTAFDLQDRAFAGGARLPATARLQDTSIVPQ